MHIPFWWTVGLALIATSLFVVFCYFIWTAKDYFGDKVIPLVVRIILIAFIVWLDILLWLTMPNPYW